MQKASFFLPARHPSLRLFMSNTMSNGFAALEALIGYSFTDVKLLKLALRHKSAGKPNNERLEFLGDAVLNAVVADSLYRQHEGAAEGKLTTARAMLVKGRTLAQVGEMLSLHELLELGMGERKSFARARQSILEDAVEAMIGAVYLDSDFDRCKIVVNGLLAGRIDEISLLDEGKDAKTQLQELTQAKQLGLPRYEVVATDGPDHKLFFTVACHIEQYAHTTRGEGHSRREAEQQAATNMLDKLQASPN